jgi:Fur family transcriptional regulator, ferric uptake regulator
MRESDNLDIKTLRKKLSQRSYRITSTREKILDFLTKKGQHKSADTIYKEIKKQFPKIGRATVFRTLKLFSDLGLVHKTDFRTTMTRFEAKTSPEHHDHMVCLKCKRIIEFSSGKIERLQNEEAKKVGFSPSHHVLEIWGYCKDCKGKK